MPQRRISRTDRSSPLSLSLRRFAWDGPQSWRWTAPQFGKRLVILASDGIKSPHVTTLYKREGSASSGTAGAHQRSHFRRLGSAIPEASLWHCLLVDGFAHGC